MNELDEFSVSVNNGQKKTCSFKICQRNPLADLEGEKTEQCLWRILVQLKTANDDLHYDFLILTNL